MQAVYVHGGVSGTKRSERSDFSAAVAAGLAASSAVDAVEASIALLEEDLTVNAGLGATLTRDGTVELDAGIVDGATGECGGVSGVGVRNPISLARRVMEETPHALMAGEGAVRLGSDMDLMEPAQHQIEKWRHAELTSDFEDAFGSPEHVETVGAVALDDNRRTAAGSSTGGVFGKMPGRVGDAPVFGAGFYATRRVAVVGTGVGELFLKTLAAARVGDLIDEGLDPQRACEEVIKRLGRFGPIPAGVLALSSDGRVGAAFRGGSLTIEGPEGPIRVQQLD